MAKTPETQQYVLLPPQGLRATGSASPEARALLHSTTDGVQTLAVDGGEVSMRVVDSIGPDGAKLVEVTQQAALSIRALRPDLRLVPVVYYTTAELRHQQIEIDAVPAGRSAAAAPSITLQVVSKKSAAPVANAFVVAFTDFKTKKGAQAVTDADGKATLALGTASVTLDRLYVYPLDANWSIIKKKLAVKTGTKVVLDPLDLGYTDGLRHFYGNAEVSVGTGVTVGVAVAGTVTGVAWDVVGADVSGRRVEVTTGEPVAAGGEEEAPGGPVRTATLPASPTALPQATTRTTSPVSPSRRRMVRVVGSIWFTPWNDPAVASPPHAQETGHPA